MASPALIDLVLQGLADNEDVQVICCQLLQDLCSWSFALFRIIGRIGDIVEPFDRCIMRCIKQVQSKQQELAAAQNDLKQAQSIRDKEHTEYLAKTHTVRRGGSSLLASNRAEMQGQQ